VSETRKKVNLDAALRDWPESRKSATEWEDLARSIVGRATGPEPMAGLSSIDDEKLFSAPLGQVDETGHNSAASGDVPKAESSNMKREELVEGKPMTMPADRERDRRSLQDLAKMAAMTPPPASVRTPIAAPSAPQSDDSGVVDLAAAAAADPSAPQRAQATALASQGLFDDVEPMSQRPPSVEAAMAHVPSIPPASAVPGSLPPASMPPASVAPISSAPMSHAPVSGAVNATLQMPVAAASVLPAEKKKKGAPVLAIVGGIVALGAIAAGGFVGLNMMKKPVEAPVALATPPAQAEPTAAAPTPEPTPEPVATAAPVEETPSDTVEPPTKGKLAAAPKAIAVKGAKPTAKEPAPGKTEDKEPPKLTAKDLPQAAGGNADLNSAMQRAAGPSASGDQKAAAGATGPQFAAGSVPQKPSQGAVTGAIGAVLPQARACLGPDDPVSRAAIVFGSEGAVKSVRVSGFAAGKPAEGCIKGALGKARLAPFAESTYTANITIRH
jgi:hypothetical protein